MHLDAGISVNRKFIYTPIMPKYTFNKYIVRHCLEQPKSWLKYLLNLPAKIPIKKQLNK